MPRKKRKSWMWPLTLLLMAVVLFAGWRWLAVHPQHNPYAPFRIAHPVGWATHGKLTAMVADPASCFASFDRAGSQYERRPNAGEGQCLARGRMILGPGKLLPPLTPPHVAPNCAVNAGLALWSRDVVQPMAQKYFGQRVARMENMGSYNCRKIAGQKSMSQHSTANAIDISAFILVDGTRISLIKDWQAGGAKAAFLRDVRDGACDVFGTTLSPDYNAAHADHFHLDLAPRPLGWTVCH